jgi:hypothetical protein
MIKRMSAISLFSIFSAFFPLRRIAAQRRLRFVAVAPSPMAVAPAAVVAPKEPPPVELPSYAKRS